MTIQSSIRDMFFEESEELLEALSEGLALMLSGQKDDETVNAVFRAVHSIKGGAGAFKLTELVAFGASTGGVDALLSLLSDYPHDCPPTMIVQHTGSGFSESLVRLLDHRCKATVMAAHDGLELLPGRVYVAAGTEGHLVLKPGKPNLCQIKRGEPVSGHIPSVDALFHSAISQAPQVVGVILTGMGKDGAAGLLALRRAGGTTIGQDEATSLVYGMPKAAFNMGAVQRQLPIQKIGAEIINVCRSGQSQMYDTQSRSAVRQ